MSKVVAGWLILSLFILLNRKVIVKMEKSIVSAELLFEMKLIIFSIVFFIFFYAKNDHADLFRNQSFSIILSQPGFPPLHIISQLASITEILPLIAILQMFASNVVIGRFEFSPSKTIFP